MIQYRAWQGVSFLASLLPLRASYAFAVIAGYAGYWLWPRGRRNLLRNYRRVLGDEGNAGQVGRRSLANYCKYLVDFARFQQETATSIDEKVEGEQSYEGLRRALAGGNGVIIVCMHFGNWDLAAAATASRGFPVTVVAEGFADPRLERAVVGARERVGIEILPLERMGPSLLRSLRRGRVLALLIDRPLAPGTGVRVPFFGREVEVPAGPARLALASGAPLVPAAFARVHPWKPGIRLMTDFGLEYTPTGDRDHDVTELTRLVMAAHERFVSQYPDQWYMFRDMWPESTT